MNEPSSEDIAFAERSLRDALHRYLVGNQRAHGDIWNVPQFPQADFSTVSDDIWQAAESLLGLWPGKCRSACESQGRAYQPGWLDADTGRVANEIGAPVGQSVNAVLLRRKQGY